jgi:predicted nucleic-acid-binding protein
VIALDTNVLVRFLVEDDVEQTARARDLLQRAIDEQTACFVPDIVLCELVWVLSSAYRISRVEIARHLGTLLRSRNLIFRSTDQIARALAAFRDGRGDFADYLIREDSRTAGCEGVATFDKALLGEEGFQAV